MSNETLDIVNEQDIVIDQQPRSLVHQRGLWHRGVHVFLFTADKRLLIQKRSADRVHSPSMLDCSVSEHVKAGESYFDAAMRGLKEEMGVTGIEISPLVKFRMNYGPNDNEISIVYEGRVDPSMVRFDPVEIQEINYFSIEEIHKMMQEKRADFCYWFEEMFKWYLGNPSNLSVMEKPSE